MNSKPKKPSLIKIIFSVLAAMFGVQSDKTRQRDFESSSPWPYILVGVVMVTLFVVSIITVVNIVVHR